MKYFISVLLLFICFNASANKSFIRGYIISSKGDTIHGFLLTQNSRSASKICVFKEQLDGSSRKIGPGEISGYRYIDGKYYVSKTIAVVPEDVKVVFMEYLIKGITNVYYYRDNTGEHYYIEKPPSGLIELTEQESTYDGTFIKPSQYRGKLSAIMYDCDSISAEIKNTRLNHKSLISLAKNYHKMVCTGEACVIYEKNNIGAIARIGIIAGISRNRYDFGNRLMSNYASCYQLGAGLKVANFLSSDDRFSLGLQVLIEKDSKYLLTPNENHGISYQVKYKGTDYLLNSGSAYGAIPELSVNLNVIDLKIPIILNYNFSVNKTLFSAGLGITDKIILYQNRDFRNIEFYNQYGKTFNTLLVGGIASFGIGKQLADARQVYVNFVYESLFAPSAVNQFLRLTENQFSVQLSYYF